MTDNWELKISDDLELATARFIRILQQAADLATPKRPPPKPATGIHSTIKRLVAFKRKTKATWQRKHTPTYIRLYNQASRTLKTALYKMRNDTLTTYVSQLNPSDHSLWNPIKKRTKPTPHKPPIGNNSTPPSPWAKLMRKRQTYSLVTSQRSSHRMTTLPIAKLKPKSYISTRLV